MRGACRLLLGLCSLALAGRLPDARAHATALHGRLPRYGVDDFLAAFQFDPQGAALFRKGARRLGTR